MLSGARAHHPSLEVSWLEHVASGPPLSHRPAAAAARRDHGPPAGRGARVSERTVYRDVAAEERTSAATRR